VRTERNLRQDHCHDAAEPTSQQTRPITITPGRDRYETVSDQENVFMKKGRMMSEFTMQRNSLFHVHRNCTPENATFCTYRIMSTGWVDGEFNRISFEMFACEVAAELLEVETGTVVVLQARCGTLQA